MPKIQYFLGANSPKGFYSLYDQLIDIGSARAVYILKGGPGCGKSTLMRRVGRVLEEKGEKTEYILCSGDPDSLDAVIFPDRKTAIVDGTAPHVGVPLRHEPRLSRGRPPHPKGPLEKGAGGRKADWGFSGPDATFGETHHHRAPPGGPPPFSREAFSRRTRATHTPKRPP